MLGSSLQLSFSQGITRILLNCTILLSYVVGREGNTKWIFNLRMFLTYCGFIRVNSTIDQGISLVWNGLFGRQDLRVCSSDWSWASIQVSLASPSQVLGSQVVVCMEARWQPTLTVIAKMLLPRFFFEIGSNCCKVSWQGSPGDPLSTASQLYKSQLFYIGHPAYSTLPSFLFVLDSHGPVFKFWL